MSIRKTILDTAAMSSVNIFRLLVQLLVIPVLSRILSPAEYGLVAIAMPFVLFAMMIADAGIGMSLVRTPAQDRHIWSTCFWLSIMFGAGMAFTMMALSPVASVLFAEPRLGPIIRMLALAVLIQSLCSIPGSALQKDLRFKRIAIIEITAVVIGITVAIMSALHGGGAWALVWQQLSFYSAKTLLTFWSSPFRPRLVFDLRSVSEHLVFGRDVLSVNLINFFTRSMDNLVIGKVMAAAEVGVYAMALQFARLPAMLVSGPLQYVFYSRLVRVKDDSVAIRRTFLVLTRVLAMLIFPGMGMVAAAWHPIFTVLLSPRWAASGQIFMLIATGSALQAVMGVCGTVRMVLGRTELQRRVSMELGGVWVVTLLSVVHFGLDWLAFANSVTMLLYSPRQLRMSLPLISCPVSVYLRAIMVPVLATLACIALFEAVTHVMALTDWMQIALAAGLVAVGIASAALLQSRALLEEYRLRMAA